MQEIINIITNLTEEVAPLKTKEDYREIKVTGDFQKSRTRLDLQNKKNPNIRIRLFLLLHFLSKESHNLSNREILNIAWMTKKFSWYALEDFIKVAKNSKKNNKPLRWKNFDKICHKYDINYERDKQNKERALARLKILLIAFRVILVLKGPMDMFMILEGNALNIEDSKSIVKAEPKEDAPIVLLNDYLNNRKKWRKENKQRRNNSCPCFLF